MPALPHPVVGLSFDSPVPPGTGWPGDPAMPQTPVAATPEQVSRLSASSASLREVEARSSVCRACPRLVGWRQEVAEAGRRSYRGQPYWGRPVPGWGDDAPWLVVLGLAPAAHGGNRTGRIFTGDRSGDWIFAALHRAGLASQATSDHAGDGQKLHGARILAPVRCAPPANRPTPAERDACAPWADRELALVAGSLRVVLALGGFAWDAALGLATRQGWEVPRPRPRFGHGARVTLPRGGADSGGADSGGADSGGADSGRAGDAGEAPGDVQLLGSYHVSQQNTFTGRLTEAMLDDVLAQAVAFKGHPPEAGR